MTAMKEWWRSAVIYQVYPRSFLDASGDGIGDLAGIIARLDHIAQLGADIVWISPFYPSPMKDFGYDVSDYRGVDPIFGSLEDFSALIERANKLNLKVMIDLVLSHTSDRHPWFIESRTDCTNAKAEWYVWADPKQDGTPPNNWLSIFGGSAWEWDTRRRQFYMHNFLTAQPDLNFHNPEVVDAVLDAARFWLELGVHGFRLDTVNWYFHDEQLRDNPPSSGEKLPYVPEASNYNMQAHVYNKSRPEVLPFLERLRALMNEFGAIGLGELTAKDAVQMMPAYTQRDRYLQMVYTFSLLGEQLSAAHIKQTIKDVEENLGSGWVCWALSNHDVTRVVSRWGSSAVSQQQQAKLFMALLLSLRGAVCLYQGEELGLTEANIEFEDLQDPYGIRLRPEYKGRDGCRTPMPWRSDGAYAGFSDVKPWLPIPEEHLSQSVGAQADDPESVLSFTKSFLAWRKSQPALVQGDITLLESAAPLVAFERSNGMQTILAVFNTSEQAIAFDGSRYNNRLKPIEMGAFNNRCSGDRVELAGYSAFFAQI